MLYRTPPCFRCGEQSEIEVSREAMRRWASGTHIQDAFPDLSVDDRELIKTGIHPWCWDIMMDEEDHDTDSKDAD